MGDTTGQSELYSPTMGDTFFSRVDLPSEETIVKSRVRISLLGRNRKKSTTSNSSSPFGGLGLGLGGLGFGGRKKKNGGRERAQTLTSSSSGPIVTGHHHPLPPLPLLPTRLQVRQGVDERLMSAGIGQGQDQVGGTGSGMGMGNSREASVVFPRREVHREVVDSGGNGEAAVGIGMGVGREGEGSPVGRQGKVEGKEGKKGWKTLKRMLSKPQMNSHAHAQGGGCEGGLEKGGEGSTGWVR